LVNFWAAVTNFRKLRDFVISGVPPEPHALTHA
jgi:hypothetical protein